jgi:hypothetical protein
MRTNYLYTSPEGLTLNKSTEELLLAVDNFQYDVLKPDYSSFGEIHDTLEIRLVSKSDTKKRTNQVSLGTLRSKLISSQEINTQLWKKYLETRDESILFGMCNIFDLLGIILQHKGEDDSVIVTFDTCQNRLGYYTRENGKGLIVLVNTGKANQMVATLIHEYIHAWADINATGRMNDAEYAEEEIAEFGMLHFLQAISGFDSKFKQILLDAIEDVKTKQNTYGLSHYGFGAELYYNYAHIKWERLLRDAHTLIGTGVQEYEELKNMLQIYPETCDLNKVAILLYYVLHKHAKKERPEIISRKQQIIDALRLLGGYAKNEDLYKIVGTSTWGTKHAQEKIRQILQQNQEFFNIRRGVWGLEECRNQIEIQIKQGNI